MVGKFNLFHKWTVWNSLSDGSCPHQVPTLGTGFHAFSLTFWTLQQACHFPLPLRTQPNFCSACAPVEVVPCSRQSYKQSRTCYKQQGRATFWFSARRSRLHHSWHCSCACGFFLTNLHRQLQWWLAHLGASLLSQWPAVSLLSFSHLGYQRIMKVITNEAFSGNEHRFWHSWNIHQY